MTSPLSPEWSALADRVVAEYRAAIGDDLVAIALLGSVARRQPRPDSDLDLYVMTRWSSLPDETWYWNLKPDWRPGEVVDL